MRLAPNLRHGLRTLTRSPGFALAVILTLSLGIAANTPIFPLVDGVLLRPLPYQDPELIIGFWGAGSWSEAELQLLRDEARSYEQVAGFTEDSLVLTGLDQPRAVSTAIDSWNF